MPCASHGRSSRTCRSWSAAPGRRRRSGTVAERADAWNTSGTVDEVRAKLEILAAHGADVGRDIGTIEKTVSFPMLLRDDRTAAEAAFRALLDVQRRGAHGRRARVAGRPGRGGRCDPAVSRSRLRDGHRPDARALRRRRSGGCPRSRSGCELEGRRSRRRNGRGEARARPAAGARARRAHRHRQHRRRPSATGCSSCRTTTRSCTCWPGGSTTSAAGGSPARRGP